MTDPSVERGSSPENDDNIEDAVVVDETPAASEPVAPLVDPVEVPTASAESAAYDDATLEAEAEPVVEPALVVEPEIIAEPEPAVAETTGAAASSEPRVVYVTAPTPPKVAGNRGFGIFIALASTVAFAIVFAIAVVIIGAAASGRVAVAFVQAPSFYVPVAFFALGAIVIALIVNRAGWAAHVFSSIIVGLVVYFGTVGALLLINGVIQNTPEQAHAMFLAALADPLVIAAGLLGREVSLWTGALVARRGRKVTQRNVDARAKWEAELAEKTAAQR
ncbi:ABC transporter [Salinibacterium sp. NYA9b]